MIPPVASPNPNAQNCSISTHPSNKKVVQETTSHPCFASYGVRRTTSMYVSYSEVRVYGKIYTWYEYVKQPTCCAYCWRNHARLLVYSRTNNEFCLSLRQHPVGDSHNTNNGMRAADGSGDARGLQEKAPSRGMRYLLDITNHSRVATRNT